MDAAQARELTKALTGHPLPAKRERLAVATYGSISASYSVAIEKATVASAVSTTYQKYIALAAEYLASLRPDKEVEQIAKDIASAAAYLVEAQDIHLTQEKGKAIADNLPDFGRE